MGVRNSSHPALGVLGLCILVLVLLAPSAQAAGCPNEAIRSEQGAAALGLPDCRAYELVSPGSTPWMYGDGSLLLGGKASSAGGALAYFSRYPALDSETSSETWLAERSGAGWAVTAVAPQITPSPTNQFSCDPGVALSEELDAHVFSAGGDFDSSETAAEAIGECSMPAEELVVGEPRGYSNLYLSAGGGPYALLNPPLAGKVPGNATFQAGSTDLSRVVFSEDAPLTAESPSGFNLYIWANGVVRQVGVLPNGESVPANLGAATRNWNASVKTSGQAQGLAPVSHAVSDDGERVIFEAGGSLYLRENAGQAPAADANCRTTSETELACTLQLDRENGGLDKSGGGVFLFASRDGSRVFFTSDHRLKSPTSAESGKPALYEYRVDERKLFDLTVNPAGTVANVLGLSGGSDDGSRLYFVARGVLTGSEQNGEGEVAVAGQPNLYLAEEGNLIYVATLSPWEEGVNFGGRDRSSWWEADFGHLRTAWSPSGRYMLFPTFKALTGFDNAPAEPGLCTIVFAPPCQELFLYDAETKELDCVSCDPTGAQPIAHTELQERMEFIRDANGPRYIPRAVLDTGQVFFDTKNPIAPGDHNGYQDVYEYRDGTLTLISSGVAVGGSTFVDASTDGGDVYFITPESLVRRDDDGGQPSIYDARIDGGFAEPPLPPAPCVGEECHPPGPSPPLAGSPTTAGFVGSGNVKAKPCKHGKVRRGGKCVKKKKHRHHKHQRAGNNRGNS